MRTSLFHTHSFRYAIALWLASSLALLVSFFIQLEPAQWSAITVWIVFMQDPRLNYSKIFWWGFGTLSGALVGMLFMVLFNQMSEAGLPLLFLWLGLCAAGSRLARSYQSYGLVLAGYTSAIVALSAVDQPDAVIQTALSRVACIAVGMASAVTFIFLLLPVHKHWHGVRQGLQENCLETMKYTAQCLLQGTRLSSHGDWRHLTGRLLTLERALSRTTAESAEARHHSAPARSLVADLLSMLAHAQAIEIHLAVEGQNQLAPFVMKLLAKIRELLDQTAFLSRNDPDTSDLGLALQKINELRNAVKAGMVGNAKSPDGVNNQFMLERMDEILGDLNQIIHDWRGITGTWTAPRHIKLDGHEDWPGAVVHGIRVLAAMSASGIIWALTEWPSGAMFILFMAVVCSLLSLAESAPQLGWSFIKSIVFCTIMAYVETFRLFQANEGFLHLALVLGLFLIPAAYAYRNPRLLGSAVISMLIFYALSMPANEMNYDISGFLNNGLALLTSAALGFFAFHAIPVPGRQLRKFWILWTVRRELANPHPQHFRRKPAQTWISRIFDRINLLQRGGESGSNLESVEDELLSSLQFGLVQRRLTLRMSESGLTSEDAGVAAGVLLESRNLLRNPGVAAIYIHSACHWMEERLKTGSAWTPSRVGLLADLREMSRLLETTLRTKTA